MLAYYTTGSNVFTLRTEDLNSGSALTLNLENMYTLTKTSSSISGYSFNDYENLLQFTASIASSSVAGEYRATITSGSVEVWAGSIQVYTSQSNVTVYTNQNQQYISNQSDNQYIIMN
jgi:hypothetical protein